MTPAKTILPFIVAMGMLATSAQASTVFEQVFKTGTTDNMKTGETAHYTVITNDPVRKLDHDQMDLLLEAKTDDDLVIVLKKGEKQSKLGTYAKSVGNPLHMFFLEKLIEAMAADTGGSPFYIRNRLKNALSTAKPIEAECLSFEDKKIAGECIVIKPFEKDKAREKMGQFADIQLYFSLDDSNPAFITGLHAKDPEKPDGFSFGLDLMP